jgi:hypothetical protein
MLGDTKMKIVKNLKVIAAAAVLVLVASACATGEVSGGGSAVSAISNRGKISIAIETKALCLKGTERECADLPSGGITVRAGVYQLVKGEFKDSGRSAAWPSGVSIKFEGRFGTYPKALAQNVAADVDCPEAGFTCWFAVVGYQSTDERNYPNSRSTDCGKFGLGDSGGAVADAQLLDLVSRSFGGVSSAPLFSETISESREVLRSDREHSDRRDAASGFALIAIIDSNNNGRIDGSDRDGREGRDGRETRPSAPSDEFMLASLCGPYSSIPGLFKVSGVTTETDVYSYASCAAEAGIWSNEDPIWLSRCIAPLSGGNLKIKMLPTTTTTTTTTLPPN